jgi:crossover junction endodeoxyribonuclease RusA
VTDTVSFFVNGKPEPQGSTRAFMVAGKPIITSANKNLKDWRTIVQLAAMAHAHMIEGPVEVVLRFYLPRPVSLPKKVIHNVKRPDVDKLARSILDALTGVFFKDDSQVVALEAYKGYADPFIGVDITVRAA